MFLIPWSTSTGSEKVLPATPKVNAAAPPSPQIKHVSFPSKQKRKRDDSASSRSSDFETKPAKRRNESQNYDAAPAFRSVYSSAPASCVGGLEAVNKDHQSSAMKPVRTEKSEMGPSMDQAMQEYAAQVQTLQLQIAQSRATQGQDVQEHVVQEQAVQQQAVPQHISAIASSTLNVTNMTSLQQTIESQFSLEILLKHRELRFIEQEMAKCQIALEQLRRCHIMPYPALSTDPNVMQSVSSGTGPAYNTSAPSPAPWGVTNGPYARHYAKWLIPDPAFGNKVPEDLHAQESGKRVSDRATRNSHSGKSHPGGSARAQRGSARENLQALPHGYPESKENKGLAVVKRSADNQMVKLVCVDCHREDLSSPQGFINHCRIAHHRNYASHEAAAIACGQPIGNDVTGIITMGNTTTSNPSTGVHPLIRSAHLINNPILQHSPAPQQLQRKIRASASPTSNNFDDISRMPSTPPAGPSTQLDSQATPQGGPSSQLYPQATPQAGPSSQLNPQAGPSSQLDPQATPQARPSSRLNPQAATPFIPSPQTPHLSALFARDGRGGNLDMMVTEAKRRPDPEALAAEEAEIGDEDVPAENSNVNMQTEAHDENMEPSVEQSAAQRSQATLGIRGGGRKPAHSRMSPAPLERPPSSKGVQANTQRRDQPHNTLPSYGSYATPSIGASLPHGSQHHRDTSPSLTSPTLNLSPNTIESHPAPSLVSDDGDYDNTHSESEAPSSADEDNYDFEVKDFEHHHPMDLDGASFGIGKPHSQRRERPKRKKGGN